MSARGGGLPPDPDDPTARAALVRRLRAAHGPTPREGEAAWHPLRGVTDLRELARVLGCADDTARCYHDRALGKLRCRDGVAAVRRLWGWYAVATRAAGAPAASETKEAA